MADDNDYEDCDNSEIPGWTPVAPMSPAHGVWFETDVIDRFMFGDDDDDDDDATSLPQYGFVPVGSITPAEVHETGSAVDHDNLKYKIDTVTVVTGIDKRINLSHLCDAVPDVFGVRSQGLVASPPETSSTGGFRNGCNFLVPKHLSHDGNAFAGLVHANGKIQMTSICSLEVVNPCIKQVVDLLEDAQRRSMASASSAVIMNYDPAVPLVLLQTELTLRLGLQLPFEVNYDRLQQLFYANCMFEQPGPAHVTVLETRTPLTCGAGPFFRMERNDFLNPPFHASFTIFKSGKIQARCSRISADVTAMKAACKSVLSILEQHRSEIEAPANVATTKQHHNKTSPPRTSLQRGSPPGIRYPKALDVVTVTLPRDMTSHISKYEQSFTDCAENCLLCFIQVALLDSGGDGRVISSSRARELGAAVEISEYFSRWPYAFSQMEYEREHHNARCEWTQLTCSRPPPCAYVRRGGFEMQAGATNFLALLQSMFPLLTLPQACMMRNCSKKLLTQGFDAATSFFSTPEHHMKFQSITMKEPTTELRTNPPQPSWIHPVRQPALCPHSRAIDWHCSAVLHINDSAVLKFVWWDRDFPAEGPHESVASGHAQLLDC